MRRRVFLLPCLALAALAASNSGCILFKKSSSAPKSITPRGTIAGKWLATVAIGGGVPEAPLHKLRETLKETFGTDMGGGYQSAFHVSDVEKPEGAVLDKAYVRARFAELKAQIAAFKAQNPGKPTMVTLGLTGHGIESRNEFKFAVEKEETFSGAEIAQMVKELDVDETILIMQSCLSGNLAQRDFPTVMGTAAVNGVARAANEAANALGVRMAVITPSSGYISSPFFSWEDILKNAISTAAKNSNSPLVTYQAWKSEILRSACSADDYFPQAAALTPNMTVRYYDMDKYPDVMPEKDEAVRAGIDPQFFESIPPNLPLFLSESGVQSWVAGTLPIPDLSGLTPASNVEVAPEVRALCDRKIAINIAAVQANAAQLADRIRNGTPEERIAFSRDLKARTFTPEELAPVVRAILESETLPSIIENAYDILSTLPKEAAATLPVAQRLAAHLDLPNQAPMFKTKLLLGLNAAFETFPGHTFDAFVERFITEMRNDPNGTLALPVLQILGKMRHPQAAAVLKESLPSPNMYVSMGASLGIISARLFDQFEAMLVRVETIENRYAALEIMTQLDKLYADPATTHRPTEAMKTSLRKQRENPPLDPPAKRDEYTGLIDRILALN